VERRPRAARGGTAAGAADGARARWRGRAPGGDRRNREYAGPHVELGEVADEVVALAYDPQAAGGLLVALPAEKGASSRRRSPRASSSSRASKVETVAGVVMS
jgi:selenophosphate synthase